MMLLMSLFILIILVQLSDLFLVYLGIVALSLSLYPLIALDKKSKGNLEAVVKYFFLGALASGLMLYGISLIYRELNTLSYEDIKNLDF
jgi:NADH-quinone oxidoreductase subunit N